MPLPCADPNGDRRLLPRRAYPPLEERRAWAAWLRGTLAALQVQRLDLARRLGVTRWTLDQYCQGHAWPPDERRAEIARILWAEMTTQYPGAGSQETGGAMTFKPGHRQSPETIERTRATKVAKALRRPTAPRTKSGYRGVRDRGPRSFGVQCHPPGWGRRQYWLGTYPTAALASAAYQDWLLAPLAGDDSHIPTGGG